MSKPRGASIIFINNNNEILLLLRDNIATIKYPNMWDIPGGNVEFGEIPEECIRREIYEEFGITISGYEIFENREFSDRFEYTFWQRADFEITKIKLTEGQCLAWFSEQKVKSMQLAFGFNDTINSFFKKAPFKSCT